MIRRKNTEYRKILAGILGSETAIFIHSASTERNAETVQVAAEAFRFRGPHMKSVSRLCLYFRPEEPLSEEDAERLGLTNEWLDRYPDRKASVTILRHYLASYPGAPLIVFNADNVHNISRLEEQYFSASRTKKRTLYSLQDVARGLLTGQTDSFKFENVMETVGIPVRSHSATEVLNSYITLLQTLIPMAVQEKPGTLQVALIKRGTEYFENPKQRSMKRMLVNTSAGKLYYDCIWNFWGKKDSDMDDETFLSIDIDDLERQLLAQFHAESMKNLADRCVKHYKKSHTTIKKGGL